MMAIGQGRGQVIEITAGFADIGQGLLVALGGVLVIQVIAEIDIRYLFQRAQGQLAFLVAINLHVRPDIDFFLGNLAGRLEGQGLEEIADSLQARFRQGQGGLDFLPFPLEEVFIMLRQQGFRLGRGLAAAPGLDEQGFAQIPGGNARRVKGLDEFQPFFMSPGVR